VLPYLKFEFNVKEDTQFLATPTFEYPAGVFNDLMTMITSILIKLEVS